MQSVNIKRYVDFKVYSVTKIKNKYGFRIKLIYEDGSSFYQQKSGFPNSRVANKERDKMISELGSGRYVTQTKVTVKDFFIFWLEEQKTRLKHSSYMSYRNAIYKHIIPKIGNITLSLLNRGHIQELYEQEAQKSQSILRLVKGIMDVSMKYALSKQMITVNVTQGVKIPKCVAKKEYRVLNIDVQKTLSVEQLKILIQAAKGTKIYLHILFSALMGLRISEVNGLKYSDVDYVSRKLKVQRQLGVKANSKKEDVSPKTYTKQEISVKTEASNREIDIPDIVFEAILKERKRYEDNKRRRINDKTNPFQDLGYICCSTSGRPRGRTYAFQHFKRLLRENNLPDIRWHDLRATYATILIKKDFNLKAISRKMGHAKQIITADVYGDKKMIINDCIDKLNPFLEEVLPQEDFTLRDYTNETEEIAISMEDLIAELTEDNDKINDYTEDEKNTVDILNLFWTTLKV